MSQQPLLAICTPHREQAFPAYFVDDLWALKRPGVANFLRLGGRPVAFARNHLVELALSGPFTHLLWLDADMHFPPDLFARLFRHDLPIVSATYFARTKSPIPHVYHWVRHDDGGHWYMPMAKEFAAWMHEHPDERDRGNAWCFEQPALVECDAIGFGAVLIKREVFEAIEGPWFTAGPDGGGEDFDFCRKAKAAGFSIHADFAIQCDHQLDAAFSGRNEFAECWGIGTDEEYDFSLKPKLVVAE